MNCDVYWNLHKHLYSVRDRATGRVAHHLQFLCMKDVSFVIMPAGQRKVRETQRKQVHAYIRGTLGGRRFDWSQSYPVYYNPYRHDTFIALCDENGRLFYRSIESAPHVKCYTVDGHPQVIAYDPKLGEEVPL